MRSRYLGMAAAVAGLFLSTSVHAQSTSYVFRTPLMTSGSVAVQPTPPPGTVIPSGLALIFASCPSGWASGGPLVEYNEYRAVSPGVICISPGAPVPVGSFVVGAGSSFAASGQALTVPLMSNQVVLPANMQLRQVVNNDFRGQRLAILNRLSSDWCGGMGSMQEVMREGSGAEGILVDSSLGSGRRFAECALNN